MKSKCSGDGMFTDCVYRSGSNCTTTTRLKCIYRKPTEAVPKVCGTCRGKGYICTRKDYPECCDKVNGSCTSMCMDCADKKGCPTCAKQEEAKPESEVEPPKDGIVEAGKVGEILNILKTTPNHSREYLVWCAKSILDWHNSQLEQAVREERERIKDNLTRFCYKACFTMNELSRLERNDVLEAIKKV